MSTEAEPEAGMDYVSFETVQSHHGIWRWKLELGASNRLVETWRAVNDSSLHPEAKGCLMNVAWSAAALERTHLMLLADARRAEQARIEGVPAVMALVSGPYEQSLEYLLTMSLWMDLGEYFASYRTVAERFSFIRGPVRRGRMPMSKEDFEAELNCLRGRQVAGLSTLPVTSLANRVLHEAWHPTQDDALGLTIHWKERDGSPYVDFGVENVRDQLLVVTEETRQQVKDFIARTLVLTGDV